MQLLQINFDDAFLYQDSFKKQLSNNNAFFINFTFEELKLINEARLFASKKKILNLKQLIIQKVEKYNIKEPLVSFYGSGDFHHLTLALLELAANRINKTFSVIHIDNHPDWCRDPVISCGSWVSEALKYSFVDKIVTLGVNSSDLKLPELKRANLQALQSEKLVLFPFDAKPSFVFKKYNNCASFDYKDHRLNWHNIKSFDASYVVDLINHNITSDYIYITIDKDVLGNKEQITNWDQGKMNLSLILEILKVLLRSKKVVGLDILGDYSTQIYGGSLFSRLYKKFEVFLDQPKKNQDIKVSAKLNEQVNLQLLKTIQN